MNVADVADIADVADVADVVRWKNTAVSLQEVANETSARVSQTSFTLTQIPLSNSYTFL